ncbi:MAG: ATP-binding protein [Candidatus Marinimicrobia bacterium]|nr:ATP-binding protein [Candidatus Neomarinimicrobiota bacterium]
MIDRPQAISRVARSFRVHPAVAIEGPRQCGKTTLARMIGGPDAVYFDLESAVAQQKLATPELTLSPLRGLVVIDEVQRMPELFPPLRVLLDRPERPVRFLLTGSASPGLVRGLSETLAGRVGIVDLSGFDLGETGLDSVHRLWLRGGFPRSFLAPDDEASAEWRGAFVRTFLERDLPQLGISIPAATLKRFWTMVAHYHGQVWNAAEFARALGADEKTARRYLDILAGSFVVRVLPPWFENLKKRQVKAPKVYIRDPGLLHSLHRIVTPDDLAGHPKLGASWEGFIIEQLVAMLETPDFYYWATHNGAELDLMVTLRGKRHGFEIKYADAPGPTKSMRVALDDLRLEHLWVIYPGSERYDVDGRITVVPAREMPALAAALR